jgi:hypothetical protein
MNEEEFAHRVAGHLSVAARNLDDGHLARLRRARERALALRRQARGVSGLLAGRSALQSFFSPMLRPAGLIVAILAAVVAGDYWVTLSRVSTMQEVDTALLIDDLPIDAYLDADFKVWVQQESRS